MARGVVSVAWYSAGASIGHELAKYAVEACLGQAGHPSLAVSIPPGMNAADSGRYTPLRNSDLLVSR
jgi:hypothetical protein